MNKSIKNMALVLIVPILMASCLTNGMDKPVINPEVNQKPPKKVIYADLYISDRSRTFYEIQETIGTKYTYKYHSRSLVEPYTFIDIDLQDNNDSALIEIPTTMLLNCNNNSIVQIELEGIIINGVCKQNSKINNNSFKEQLENTFNQANNNTPKKIRENLHSLIFLNNMDQEIILQQDNLQRELSFFIEKKNITSDEIHLANKLIWSYGPDDYLSNKKIEEIAFNNQNPFKKTKHQFFMDSQIGLRKKQPRLTSIQKASEDDQTAVYEFDKKNTSSMNRQITDSLVNRPIQTNDIETIIQQNIPWMCNIQ